MEYSIIKLTFALLTFTVLVGSGLVNFFENYIPKIVIKSFRYGKFAYKKKVFGAIEVPRRWFKHFYVFALVWSTIGLLLVSWVYLISKPVPLTIRFLNVVASSNRSPQVSATSTYLAMVLLTIQCWKRFYETHYINIFSDSTINLVHYVSGYYHYFGAVIAILAEAPGFTSTTSLDFRPAVAINSISWWDWGLSLLFLWATWNQLKSVKILADLRKNKKGEVIHMKHSIPQGGLFSYVSSPHISCEILMYTILTIILWGNFTWPYIFLWVLSNQVECAFLSHWWYRETFKDYPSTRCALIPFVI